MIVTKKIHGLVVTLGFLLGSCLLSSCLDEEGLFQDEKKAQNEQEIAEYLSKSNLTVQKNLNGLYYKVLAPGTSLKQVGVGDEVQFHYKITRLDGHLVDTSEINKKNPYILTYGVRALPYVTNQTMFDIFNDIVKEGDSAVFIVPYFLGRGSAGTLDLPAYSPFRMDLKIVKIRTEDNQITDFISKYNIFFAEKLESGLRFGTTVTKPDSALVADGSTYSVKYSGHLMNNMRFDSSTFDVTIGSTSLVAGFTEGLKKMRVGEKANLIFPSNLGYGTQGSQSSDSKPGIPPYAPLYFQVEVLKKK